MGGKHMKKSFKALMSNVKLERNDEKMAGKRFQISNE